MSHLSQIQGQSGLRHEPLIHLAARGEDGLLQNIDGSDFDTLFKEARNRPSCSLQIFFLPPIHLDGDKGETTLISDKTLCKELERSLHISPAFLTKDAWNSNGFFSIRHVWKGQASQALSSRYLIKLLEDKMTSSPEKSYSWLFLAFHQLWFEPANGEDASCILLCFDDSKVLKDEIKVAYNSYPSHLFKSSLFGVQDVLARVIADTFDRALWLFRKPVRSIERGRDQFAKDLDGLLQENTLARQESSTQNHHIEMQNPYHNKLDQAKKPTLRIEAAVERYNAMHELSRHAIHMTETLEVATDTVNAIFQASKSWHGTGKDNDAGRMSPETADVTDGLRFSADHLRNLKRRGTAFTDRLRNEIRLAYNMASTQQLRDTKQILQENRDDGKDLTRTVTFLTLFFLPGTFITSFFGMNFFVFTPQDLWIFWLITTPVTIIALTIWVLVHYKGWQPKVFPFPPELFRMRPKRRRTF